MNFRQFFESFTDAPTIASASQTQQQQYHQPQTQQQSAQTQNQFKPDLVSKTEEIPFLKNLSNAYAQGNTKQFADYLKRAVATGQNYRDNLGFTDLREWWKKVHDSIVASHPNKAKTDHFVQQLGAYINNNEYDSLYDMSYDGQDFSGETKMQRLGGGVRDADAILNLSSKAQHSDL